MTRGLSKRNDMMSWWRGATRPEILCLPQAIHGDGRAPYLSSEAAISAWCRSCRANGAHRWLDSHNCLPRSRRSECVRSGGCTGLAMKTLNRTIFGSHRMASALLLSGFVLCNFGAQADVHVPYLKIGGWSLEYLEVGKLNGCRAQAQFPDQTIFQMVLIQSGTDKAWVIFISNPKWNLWIGKKKQHQLWLVTTRADSG